LRLLRPLRHRDFAVLWAAQSVSLLGGGISGVAATWQAYVLWGTLTQRSVPRELRGRISALSSLAAFGLLPLSYAFTAPLAAVTGVQPPCSAPGCWARS
jgi:hypothetical protein